MSLEETYIETTKEVQFLMKVVIKKWKMGKGSYGKKHWSPMIIYDKNQCIRFEMNVYDGAITKNLCKKKSKN